GLDVIHQRALQQTFDLTKFSTQFSIELTRRRPFTAGLAYEFGYQNLGLTGQPSIEDVLNGIFPQAIFRTPVGHMWFGALLPNATLDLRDDPARRRSGFLAQLGGDFLHSFAIGRADATTIYANLLKVQGLAAVYLPLPALSSVVVSARGGRNVQLDVNS